MALKRCHTAFYYIEDGAPRVLRIGDLVDDNDDAYKNHKAMFEVPRVTNFPRARAVEQASAAPGEKRRRSRSEN